MAVFFTSDTHFNDPRVLRIDRRPFASLAEHDAALIANWNARIADEDVVWHLGDFARPAAPGRIEGLLGTLRGNKHLIVGNNDGPETLHSPLWLGVQHYAEITVDERRLVLCHYPFRTWNDMGKGTVDLHGHSHGKLTPQPRQYDVGVDAWDFHPVLLEEILARRRRKAAAARATPRERASS